MSDLNLAIMTRNVEAVKESLKLELVNNDAVDYRERTLHKAILTNNSEIVDLVLKAGAKVENDLTNPDGTPNYIARTLSNAIKIENLKIVDLVLKAGAKVENDLTDLYNYPIYGERSLCNAIKTNNPEIVHLLLKAGAKIENDSADLDFGPRYRARTLSNAIETENPAIIDLVLIYGASPDSLPDNHYRRQGMLERKEFLEKAYISDTATKLSAIKYATNPEHQTLQHNPISQIPYEILIEIAKFTPHEVPPTIITPEQCEKAAEFGASRVIPIQENSELFNAENLEISHVKIRQVTRGEFIDRTRSR